ncbi:MAG: response regulator [Thermodesulfobacteriota bacterium]
MKLLIADDDPTVHVVFTRFLTKNGFEVFHANNGREALAMAQAHRPDIILLDLLMPEMDGRDVCKALKADPGTNLISVVMLTARDQPWDRLLGLELGADEYIEKPCDLFYLDRVVTRIRTRREG